MKRRFAPHNAIYVKMLGFLAEKPYLPVLRGKAAARFVEEADRNAKERRGSIDFTKQVEKMRAILKRSRLYREG